MLSLNAWICTVKTLSWKHTHTHTQQITRLLCMCMCAMLIRVQVYLGLNPEVPIWVYSTITLHLTFWGSASHRTWCSPIQLGWLVSHGTSSLSMEPALASPELELPPYLHFYVDTWNWTYVLIMLECRCFTNWDASSPPSLVSFLLGLQLLRIHPLCCLLSCGSQD